MGWGGVGAKQVAAVVVPFLPPPPLLLIYEEKNLPSPQRNAGKFLKISVDRRGGRGRLL